MVSYCLRFSASDSVAWASEIALKALRGLRIVRVGVRMVLLREPTIGLLDLVLARTLGDAKHLIEVLGHLRVTLPWNTCTRAGRTSTLRKR
jgi:hypothetical protein